MEVLEKMRTANQAPSLSCFNRAIRACCEGDAWPRGVGLLRRMEAFGHSPDEGTYTTILRAFEKAGEWQGSMKLLEYIGEKADEGKGAPRVTQNLAKAAADICHRAHRVSRLIGVRVSASCLSN